MMIPVAIASSIAAIIGSLWGSFLAATAYRIVTYVPFFVPRSYCPSCENKLAWYDLFPFFSYVFLKGRCRTCATSISFVYPFIEFLTAVIFFFYTYSFFHTSWYATLFFHHSMMHQLLIVLLHLGIISLLLLSVATDLFALVIPQFASWVLAAIGLFHAYLYATPITLIEACLASMCGFFFLWVINKLYVLGMKREGIGFGDMELLAGIGAVVGIGGMWESVMIASFTGVCIGGIIAFYKGNTRVLIPFAPFLAIGATISFLYPHTLSALLGF